MMNLVAQRACVSSAAEAVLCSLLSFGTVGDRAVRCASVVVQGLKPPFSFARIGTTEQLAEKCLYRRKTVPQGLKPGHFAVFTAQLKLCPFKASIFSQAVKSCPVTKAVLAASLRKLLLVFCSKSLFRLRSS
ncbi:MAG TPA: hypothetical protein VHZ09_01385 [Acidobacteriaceae bacterium]|jgi:hypothetical protein|nr:hypothetical protein [Acidobacteriaceae bacterium]